MSIAMPTVDATGEAKIESCYRRLLAAIESDRQDLLTQKQKLELYRVEAAKKVEQKRRETEAFRNAEKERVLADWSQLEERKGGLFQGCFKDGAAAAAAPDESTFFKLQETFLRPKVVDVVAGGECFRLPLHLLFKHARNSLLSRIFSNGRFLQEVPTDAMGRYVLSAVHPGCFRLLLNWLDAAEQTRNTKAKNYVIPPAADVPPNLKHVMDVFSATFRLPAFTCSPADNRWDVLHGTSLEVKRLTVGCVHSGWQVITAMLPFDSRSDCNYFEVTVVESPNASNSSDRENSSGNVKCVEGRKGGGGIAIGLLGHGSR